MSMQNIRDQYVIIQYDTLIQVHDAQTGNLFDEVKAARLDAPNALVKMKYVQTA